MSRKHPKRIPRDGVDEYGRTPLHYAAADGDLSLLLQLLSTGDTVDLPDDDGWTPLHFASQGQHSEMAAELISRGADPNVTNAQGNTSLWLAVMHFRDELSTIQILVDAGGDPDIPNGYDVTARDVADRKEVVCVLDTFVSTKPVEPTGNSSSP